MRKKKYDKVLIIMVILSMLFTGCGYSPLPYNNDNDQSWDDDWQDDENDKDDEFIDDDEQDDWNDVWQDDEDEEDPDNELVDEEIVKGLDRWQFENKDLDLYAGVSGYYISEEDYYRLISNLSPKEQNWLQYSCENEHSEKATNYNVGNTAEKYEEWNGSCYGLAVTAALTNRNIVSADELHAGSSLLSSILNKENFSAINYYFWQQMLAPCRQARSWFEGLDSGEQVQRIVNVAKGGEPFVFDFFWWSDDEKEVCGHTVEGYGVEFGNWSWKKGDYSCDFDAKILVYDSNFPYKTEDEHMDYAAWDLYLNMKEGEWCVPAYNVWSTTNDIETGSLTNNGKFGAVQLNTEYLNAVDYTTGVVSGEYQSLAGTMPIATVQFSAQDSYEIESSSGKASINGLVVENSTYGEKLTTAAITGGYSNTIQAYLPQNETYYNISSDEDMNVMFDVGNMFVAVQSDTPGELEVHDNGSIELINEEEPEKCEITITSDDSNAFGIEDCNTIEINGAGATELTISQSDSGLVIEGDDLSELTVSGEMYGKKQEINANTSGEAVLIDSDTNQIRAVADTTNDGAYDTVISETEIPVNNISVTLKNKTVTYNGKNQSIGKASLSGLDTENVIYLYYQDKECRKEAENHKNAGTYYVKACVLNECGTFYESNVAKLTIKKAAQKINLKTKSFKIKASTLKSKSKTVVLKATAKGKVTYKKVSGNSKIKVLSSGKVTIKKGLKKGTYKLKVRLTAKATGNWNKTTKTITIPIKIK